MKARAVGNEREGKFDIGFEIDRRDLHAGFFRAAGQGQQTRCQEGKKKLVVGK
jgi:hypothetical protein